MGPVRCSLGGSLGLESAGGSCSSVTDSCVELTEGACWKLELCLSLLLCRRECCLEIDVDSVIRSLGGSLGLESAGEGCSSVTGSCVELTEAACWKLELHASLLLCRRGSCLEIDVDSVIRSFGGSLGLESVGEGCSSGIGSCVEPTEERAPG